MRFGPSFTALVLVLAACKSPGAADTGEEDDDDVGDTLDPPDGRIPGCQEDMGIDLFAAEADGALGLTWNNNVGADFGGGYRVRLGAATGEYGEETAVACDQRDCEFNLGGLTNGVTYFLVVDALDAGGATTHTSCEVSATPHVLGFGDDQQINDPADGVQDFPDIVAERDGLPIFVAWEDQGSVRLLRSDTLGDTWGPTVTVGSGSRPALAFRDEVVVDGVVEIPATLFIAYADGGNIQLVRGDFAEGPLGPVDLSSPVVVGPGGEPDVAATADRVHVAWENDKQVFAATGPGDGALGAAVRVDTGGGESFQPSIAANQTTGDVYVAFHAIRGAGDTNVYLNVSTNAGAGFGAAEVRIDDDPGGQNQLNISFGVDDRSQQLYATWEDRRGGANVYFSHSFDNGATWEPNLETGAGLGGDQFTPQAAIDPGRNAYVFFVDTTDGRRPLFSRFNPDGTFDPPLEASERAGKAGAAANNPSVATDRYGTIYAVWSENRDSPDLNIFFARAD
jgi:hypothetical protein